jgi:hypothetical protein
MDRNDGQFTATIEDDVVAAIA